MNTDQLNTEIARLTSELAALREERGQMKSEIVQLRRAVKILLIGSCDCQTKTPDIRFHAEGCRYREARAILDPAHGPAKAIPTQPPALAADVKEGRETS